HAHGSDNDLDVRLFQQLRVGRERELVDDQTGEIVERIEALQQQGEQRADIDDADPQQRRQQKQEGQELGPSEKEVGDRVGDPTSPIDCRHVAHAPSSMVTIADLGQSSRTPSPCLKSVSQAAVSALSRVSPVSTLKRVTAPW